MGSSLRPTQLTVRSILDQNPVWVRAQLPDDTNLLADIKKNGMLLPVLLTEDWQVVDGARRMEVARKLGWDVVPVLIDPSWDDVKKYFEQARAQDSYLGLSVAMSWMELADVWGGPLTQLYVKERYARAAHTRRHNLPAARREDGVTAYNLEVAQMYGYGGTAVKEIRGIRSSGNTFSGDPQLFKRYWDMVDQYQQVQINNTNDPRTVVGVGRLRHTAQHLANGRLTWEETKATLARPHGTKGPVSLDKRVARQVERPKPAVTFKPPVRADTSSSAGRLVNLLMTVGAEARAFNFDLSPVSSEQAGEWAVLVQKAVNDVNAFKRHLQYLAEQNPTE